MYIISQSAHHNQLDTITIFASYYYYKIQSIGCISDWVCANRTFAGEINGAINNGCMQKGNSTTINVSVETLKLP